MLNPRLTEEEKPKTQLPPLQPIATATPPLAPTPSPAPLETAAPLDTTPAEQAEAQAPQEAPRLLDPSRRFNFARARLAGVSDSDLLGFLQAQDTNIDWEALEKITPDPAQKIAMLSRNDWSFYKPLETPKTPTKQALEEEPPPELPQTPTKQPQEANPHASTLNPRKAPPTESKNLFDRAAELVGFSTERGARIDKDTEDYIYSAQQEGRGFDDLDKGAQAHLAQKAQADKDLLDIFTTPQELARALYDKEKKAIEIAKTPQAALSPEQKAHIKKEASLFQKIFSDDEEIYRDFIETERARKIVPQEMKHALEVLDNLHGHKDIASLLTGSNEELKSDYLESVHTIAKNLGFSGIATNAKGEIFIEKDKQYYRVESGFIESLPTILLANTGSIGAGIAGSIAGFKYGSRLGGAGATAGAILGGGIGAFTGGAADVVLGNLYLNRENTASEILAHATQEGALSVVGDTVILGALKAYDKLSAGGGIKNALGTITDYIPVVGLSKRLFDGNAKRAQELLATSYTPDQLQALQKASLDFGANLTLGEAKKNLDNLADKLGADSPLTQGYEKLTSALRLDSQSSAQESFLQAIRADEHGTLTAFLSEAAAQSPTAQRNLANILNATTARLTRELEALRLDKGDIKRVFDDLESGTKDSYNQAMTDVLEQIYNDSYKVNLNELKEKTGRQGDSTQSLNDIVALIESEQQKGRNMPLIGRENVTPELLEYVQKNNKKIAIEKLAPEEARELGFKHPEDARVTITADAINHILRRHGVDSPLVKNGQPPIKLFEISNVPSFKPDERFKITNEHGEKIVIGFKQVNGHFTVVQHMKTKHNELDLKTMYKENGDYKNSEAYKRLKNNPEATALTPSYEGYGRVTSPTAIITREGDYTPKKANNKPSTPTFTTLPTKTTIQYPINQEELRARVISWDLQKPSPNDKVLIEQVSDEEAQLLAQHMNLNGNYALAREINAENLAHALNRHANDTNPANISITREEVLDHYPSITKNYDKKGITNNSIIYTKRVNGHFIVIEEVLTGRNKLRFKSAWKQKGTLNEEVLFKNARVFPNTLEAHKTASDKRNLDRTLGGTSRNQNPSNKHYTQTSPNPQSFQKFKDELERAGVTPQESANFLNFIEKNIYNPQGVTFTQLNNALKNLNSYYKQAQDPNFKDHIKRALDNFLRQDIKAGVEAIFAQNQPAYKSALSLYQSALQDYATMKSTLKLADKLKLRNATTTHHQALETLLKIAKGQGEQEQNNIAILTKALDQNNRALVELNMLQTLLEKSLIDKEALRVLDSGKFMSEVKKLAENNTFTTPHAKEYINLVEKFHKLFKNDALLAKAIKPALTEKMGSSIATSIEGAVRMQATKQIFSHLVRLLPKLYIPSVDKRVAGAALRYHLRQALESSHSISELNHHLEALPRSRFTNDTYKILEEITGKIDHAQDEILQQAQRITTLQAAKYQDPATPAPALGENFPSYYHTGAQAIEKLLQERRGQVAGAFYREDLGDIDLAWGQVSQADNRGFGLAKIERNAERGDFAAFGEGEQGLINALSEIIERGKLVESGEENIQSLWLKRDSSYYLAGLSKGFYEEGEDKWLLTSFKKETPEAEDLEKLERLFNEGQEAAPTPTPTATPAQEVTPAKEPAQESKAESKAQDTQESSKAKTPTDKKKKGGGGGGQGGNSSGSAPDLAPRVSNPADSNAGTREASTGTASEGEAKASAPESKAEASKATPTEAPTPKAQETTPARHPAQEASPTVTPAQAIKESEEYKHLERLITELREKEIQEINQQLAHTKADDEFKQQYMEEALKDLYRDHKPKEVTELERKYFNKEMPKEWQELIQDFPQLKAQWIANDLKDKDTFTRKVEYRKKELLEKFKDKPFAKTDSEFFKLKRDGFYGLLSQEVKDRLGFKQGGFTPDEMPAALAQNKKAERALRFMLKKGDIEDLATELIRGEFRNYRQEIEREFNIKPLAEFGENYAEFFRDGEGAIAKLMQEREGQVAGAYKGQVAGAFYREELGDIDLVWGDSSKGLAHILERRAEDFIEQGMSKEEAEAEAVKFVKTLAEIIENGKVEIKQHRAFIDTQEARALIALDYKGEDRKWVLTAYSFNDLNPAEPHSIKHNIAPLSVSRGDAVKDLDSTTKPTTTQVSYYNDLNESLKRAHDFFKKHNKDEYNDRLFDKVLEVANQLDVRYWTQSNPVWIGGSYTYYLNRAMVDSKIPPEEASKTLLHELIHTATSRAIYVYDNPKSFTGKGGDLLSPMQKQGIEELKNIYKEVVSANRDKQWIELKDRKAEVEANKGKTYGLKNEHEMLAELSNKDFRDFLEKQNLWQKLISALAKIYSTIKEALHIGAKGEISETNALNALESSLDKILKDYNPDFTNKVNAYFNATNFVESKVRAKYIKENKAKFEQDNGKNGKWTYKLVEGLRGKLESGDVVRLEFIQKMQLNGLDCFKKYMEVNHFTPSRQAENLRQYDKSLDSILKTFYSESLEGFYSAFEGRLNNIFHTMERQYLVSGWTSEATNEGKFIIALQPYFLQGLHKELDSAYFDYIKENVMRILESSDITYRNHDVREWFAKEWVEQDIKKILESKEGAFYSLELEKGFLDSSGRVDYEKIKQYATPMPKPQSEQEFTTNLLHSPNATPNKANNRVKYKTPAGEVNIYLPYAYRHFSKEGKWGNSKENRENLTGALQQILDTPAFVTKDKQDTQYFYKPFVSKQGIINIVSISIAKNGKLDYRTTYEATQGRLLQMITEHDLVYMQDIAT